MYSAAKGIGWGAMPRNVEASRQRLQAEGALESQQGAKKVTPMDVETTKAAVKNKVLTPHTQSMNTAATYGKWAFGGGVVFALVAVICGAVAGGDTSTNAWTGMLVTGTICAMLLGTALIQLVVYCVERARRYYKDRFIEDLAKLDIAQLKEGKGVYETELRNLRAERDKIESANHLDPNALSSGDARVLRDGRARLPRIKDDIEKNELLLNHVNARINKLEVDAVKERQRVVAERERIRAALF